MTDLLNRVSAAYRSREVPYLRLVAEKVQAVSGINLAQGTCQLAVPPEVLEAARCAINSGLNRYTLAAGTHAAREAIARKLRSFNGIEASPETEIIITPGVTGAFEAVCSTLLEPGDEVISFEPFYPYHHGALRSHGVTVRYVKLVAPDWSFNPSELERAISSRTKFLLLNTPSNPTGKVFTAEELSSIGEICERNDIIVVTDEMYEYLTFDGRRHVSPATLPSFRGRTVTMGGYSKTFAITGWRIGYAAGPSFLIERMTKVIDEIYICAPSPFQAAVAEAIGALGPDFYSELASKYERKRAMFCDALKAAGFDIVRPQGAYYIAASFDRSFGKVSSTDFVDLMIDNAKVAAVPANDFVIDPVGQHWVRFCFAVEDDVLTRAGEQLLGLRHYAHSRAAVFG